MFLECLRLFSSLAAHAASLTSGRIFPFSFSAGVSKSHLVTDFTEGDWKIPQGAACRLKAKFFSGNSEL
ncbi:MAG: hypothetical protein EA344_08975 [Alkalicoccus sp.]|nr:MAG: hypothetical protein EA344_08975 [Alkalicoccus sp.]